MGGIFSTKRKGLMVNTLKLKKMVQKVYSIWISSVILEFSTIFWLFDTKYLNFGADILIFGANISESYLFKVNRGVPGLGPSTWWIVCWQKMRDHIRKNLYGNQEILVKWTVGVWDHADSWLEAQMGSVLLKSIQTLKEYFSCHIYCAHLDTPWYQIVGFPRTVSNRESRYPRRVPVSSLELELVSEGTWTRPDYLVNCDDPKNEGPFGEKNCTEIIDK